MLSMFMLVVGAVVLAIGLVGVSEGSLRWRCWLVVAIGLALFLAGLISS